MHFQPILAANEMVELAKATGEQFGFQTQLFISQVISFCIVAFLLHRFAYKPILKVLDERRRTISQSLENAEKIKRELAQAQTKAHEILSQANAQANKQIEEARAVAAKVQEQETQKAIAAANQIVAKAKEASEAELVRMKGELRKEMVRLVAETTAKVSGKVLTLDDQKRLADETTKQLAA
jgi:F-type H+-transporting ATPase subunit b